jgi:hypothetical protein
MTSQLALDGREITHPPRAPKPLSERQRELIAYMRTVEHVRPQEVGLLMHAGRPEPRRLSAARHASSDGVDALARLQRRGLVERVKRGCWRVCTHEESW